MMDDRKSLKENLKLFLKSSNHCALFDSARESSDYRSQLPIWLAELGTGVLDQKLFEFDSRGLSNGLLISQIVEQSRRNKKTESHAQLLCDYIETARPALIVIHGCSELPSKTKQFLSSITAYLKDSNSDWKILYFGNLRDLSPTSRKRYLADAVYPSFSEHLNTSNSNSWMGRSTSLLLLFASVGLLLWFFIAKKPEAMQVDSPISEKVEPSAKALLVKSPSHSRSGETTEELQDWTDHIEEFDMMMAKYSDTKAQNPVVQPEPSRSKVKSNGQPWSTQGNPAPEVMRINMLSAVKSGDTAALITAIKAGSDVNSVTPDKLESALIIAATEGHKSSTAWLIDNDANINQLDSNDRSPLFYAAVNGHIEIARKLLEKGAQPNSTTKLKKTPLMAAVHNNHFELSRLLVDAKSDINRQDHSGWSALFYAVWNNNREISKLLINSGAKPDLRDKEGYTATDIAKAKGAADILKILAE